MLLYSCEFSKAYTKLEEQGWEQDAAERPPNYEDLMAERKNPGGKVQPEGGVEPEAHTVQEHHYKDPEDQQLNPPDLSKANPLIPKDDAQRDEKISWLSDKQYWSRQLNKIV